VKAAIYCHRSTEQTGDKKVEGVAHQKQLARDFAHSRHWSVHRDNVYVDDGISGAEFERRPGLQAMLAAAARGEFRVLVVSEQKSLGREIFGVGALIKQLAENGVEVWSYMGAKSLTPEDAIGKAMFSLQAYGDEAHREATSRRNHEGATSKHARGHVVGGRVFGYRNVDVCNGTDEHGRPLRSHVDREVDPEQAATVVRIFEMFASGVGLKGIAKRLTDEGVPGPKPFARKDGTGLAPYRGWAPSTVRAILGREDYRSVYVWNRSRKREVLSGKVKQRPRPESEWKRIEKPHWRIVSDDLWNCVAERRRDVEATSVRLTGGRLSGRPPKDKTLNLLAGIAKCGVCSGGLTVETYFTKAGQPRRAHYVCNRRRASGACSNTLRVPVADMEDAVLTAIEDIALTPEAVEGVLVAMQSNVSAAAVRSVERELKELDKRIARLTDAIAAGGELTSLVAKLREMEAKRAKLVEEQYAQRPVPMPPRSLVEDRLAEWRRMLRQPQTARVVLDRVLRDRITFMPDGLGYVFQCPTRYDRLFSGLVVPQSVWTLPAAPGADGIMPDDVYYRGERDADFGELLRRVANRKGLASPTRATGLGPVRGVFRRAA
jgi:site-specific DNA recombinase